MPTVTISHAAPLIPGFPSRMEFESSWYAETPAVYVSKWDMAAKQMFAEYGYHPEDEDFARFISKPHWFLTMRF